VKRPQFVHINLEDIRDVFGSKYVKASTIRIFKFTHTHTQKYISLCSRM